MGWVASVHVPAQGGGWVGVVRLGWVGVLIVCFKAGYFFNEVMPWQI